MSMKKALFLAAVMAVTAWATQLSAKTLETFNIRGWKVSVMSSDRTNLFASCIAMADYKSGMILAFQVTDELDWSMAFFEMPHSFYEGQKVDVSYQIDSGPIHKISARAMGRDSVLAPLPDRLELFNEFRQGILLRILVNGRVSGFRLDGTSAMLSTLVDCAKTYRNIPQANAKPPATAPRPTGKDTGKTAEANKPKATGTFAGSGFFVTEDGAAVTNAHVVEGCDEAMISGYGKAKIVAVDVTNDLALLKVVAPTATTPARFRKKPVQLGEIAYVMGFPLAGQLDNGLNFTSGSVSSLSGPGNDSRSLQVTAPIQSGNSGGPIVDESGLLIGVTQSKLSEVAAIQSGGAFPQNVNFGLKSDLAANFLRANAVEPRQEDAAGPQPPVAIARDGRGYTIQIKCTPP